MKRWLDKLLPWRVKLAALEREVERLNIAVAVRDGTIEQERAAARKLAEAHEQNKRGTGVLLEFIYRTHRLSVPNAEGSIRQAIQKGMT